MGTRLRLVRGDEKGIYLINGSARHRPGPLVGYSHAYRMDSGGLRRGDHVEAYSIAQTPLMKLRLSDGEVLYWADEYEHETRRPG